VEDWPQPVLRVGDSTPIQGQFSRIPLSFEGAARIEDLHPLGDGRFAIQANQELFILDEAGHAREVSEGRVEWSQLVASNRVAFSECWLTGELSLSKCNLVLTTSDGETRAMWTSEHLWPVDLVVLDEATFLVQVANETKSGLVLLTSKADGWESRFISDRGDAEGPALEEAELDGWN